jgi:hypothetical protein
MHSLPRTRHSVRLTYRRGYAALLLALLLAGGVYLGLTLWQDLEAGGELSQRNLVVIVILVFEAAAVHYAVKRLFGTATPAFEIADAGFVHAAGGLTIPWHAVDRLEIRKPLGIAFVRIHYATADPPIGHRMFEFCASGLSLAPGDVLALLEAKLRPSDGKRRPDTQNGTPFPTTDRRHPHI